MIALLHPVFIHYRFFPRCSPINELTNLSKDNAHVREGGTGPNIEDSKWRTFTIIASGRFHRFSCGYRDKFIIRLRHIGEQWFFLSKSCYFKVSRYIATFM